MGILGYCRDFLSFMFGAPQLVGASLMVLVWLGLCVVLERTGEWKDFLEGMSKTPR